MDRGWAWDFFAATLLTAEWGTKAGHPLPIPPFLTTLLRSPFRFETQPRVTWTVVGPGAVGPRRPRRQAQAQRRPVHGDGMGLWPAPSGRGTCPCYRPAFSSTLGAPCLPLPRGAVLGGRISGSASVSLALLLSCYVP